MIDEQVIKPGSLLIAPPRMQDPRFRKSVIMVSQSRDYGHQGFVLNRQTDNSVNQLIEDTGIRLKADIPLYWGGPVSIQNVWMLHDSMWRLPYTIEINDQWSMTSHRSMFEYLDNEHRPNRFRIFYGFAGWGPEQLMSELRGEPPFTHNSSWLTLDDPDPNWIYQRPADDLWTDAVQFCAAKTVSQWL